MNFTKVKVITTIPHKNAEAIRQALGEAGAGSIGDYRYCSFFYYRQGSFYAD